MIYDLLVICQIVTHLCYAINSGIGVIFYNGLYCDVLYLHVVIHTYASVPVLQLVCIIFSICLFCIATVKLVDGVLYVAQCCE